MDVVVCFHTVTCNIIVQQLWNQNFEAEAGRIQLIGAVIGVVGSIVTTALTIAGIMLGYHCCRKRFSKTSTIKNNPGWS